MSGAALVLSGGGTLAIGWELGILRGLQDGGADPGRFDLIIGTSAGAIAGVVVASGVPLEAVAPNPERDRELASMLQQVNPAALAPAFAVMLVGGDPDPARRAQIGAIARQTQIPEERFLEVARQYVPDVPWPERLVIAAVDADDGAFVSWGAGAGVPLVHAVAASAAIPAIFPPITIAGRRYMDGAVRSPTSADLASHSDLVVIVAAPSRSEQSDRQIAEETAAVRGAGGVIEEIRPDAETAATFGPDPMDGSRQPLIFEAGRRQGRDVAGDIANRLR